MWATGKFEEEAAARAIGAAIRVHRELGPGLLESVYEACLAYELTKDGIDARRQVPIPVVYEELVIEGGFRVDLLVGSCVVIEVRSIDALLPVHRAQLLSYLRLGGFRLGLLMNFNVSRLTNGIRRIVNDGRPQGKHN